jgi:hypothetical protein
VNRTNTPLVAHNHTFSMHAGTILSIAAPGLLEDATGGDGHPLSAALISGPAAGILTLNTNGAFEYVPTNGLPGLDSFDYVASDGSTNSGPATVTIDIADQLRILSLEITNDAAAVTWTAIASHTYRLQYQENLIDTNWHDVLPDVFATGPTASATNSSGNAIQRFYRVLFVQ